METTQSDLDKLAKAKDYKAKGNQAHKDGNFKKAIGNYHRALLHLKGLSVNCPDLPTSLLGLAPPNAGPKMPLEMDREAKDLTCDCFNNLAACLLKEPEPKYERIVEHCDSVLEISPTNSKALYRKGVALYGLGKYDLALETLLKAAEDAAVTRQIQMCQAKIKEEDKELSKIYKNMFVS